MKKITFFRFYNSLELLLFHKKINFKSQILIFAFLFLGIFQAKADCTVPNNMNATQFLAFANTCSGTITIPSGITIDMDTSITIPSTIDRIVIKDGGHILWSQNSVTLTLATNSAIVIEDLTVSNNQTDAIGTFDTHPCNNTEKIKIGNVDYSACTGQGNVCVLFSTLIENGGTIQIDPSFNVISGSGNEVCLGPLNIQVVINGYAYGTPTFLWTKISGPGTATFTPDNADITTVNVSTAGTYVFDVQVQVPLSSTCLTTIVTVHRNITIVFRNAVVAGITNNFPGTCNNVVDFNGTATNGSANTTYLWDFGDGSATSTLQNPSHTYNANGDYTVQLTVTDPNGIAPCNTNTITKVISAKDLTPPTITCPTNINVNTDAGICAAAVTIVNPTAT
ncbi:PKD domain-containing protein, partial [Flavobacterium flevense]